VVPKIQKTPIILLGRTKTSARLRKSLTSSLMSWLILTRSATTRSSVSRSSPLALLFQSITLLSENQLIDRKYLLNTNVSKNKTLRSSRPNRLWTEWTPSQRTSSINALL
jgi:hypothetical protein